MLVSGLSQIMIHTKGISIRPRNTKHRPDVRKKAIQARLHRASTVICVLENPKNLINIASVMRNVDGLGVSKLYVISKTFTRKEQFHSALMTKHSASANLWIYIHVFETSEQCLAHLAKKKVTSVATTPHQEAKDGYHVAKLEHVPWHTFQQVAIWFGNEITGIEKSTLPKIPWWVFLPMGGMVESLNLASCTAIVLYHVVRVRKDNHSNGNHLQLV
jgi:tRNA (guanosine-2'-O-)-methyltransferase